MSVVITGYLRMGLIAMRVDGLTTFSCPRDKGRRKLVENVARLKPGDREVSAAEFRSATKIKVIEHKPRAMATR